MSLVAAYEDDHVTNRRDQELFLSTESLCFGGVPLSLGSIRSSTAPKPAGCAPGCRRMCGATAAVSRLRREFPAPSFSARNGARFFVDFVDFSIGLGTDK